MGDIAGFAPGGDFMSQDKAVIEREMNEMARTGVRWFRVGFQWSGMEGRPGVYSFSKHEWLRRAREGPRHPAHRQRRVHAGLGAAGQLP